jgi:hypothetical protein
LASRQTKADRILLIAQGRLTEPLVLLGRETPEWVESSASDFVINFRFNLDANEGLRLVFRFNEGVGYNALEMNPGRLFLKRGRQGANPTYRPRQRTHSRAS